MSSPSAIAAPVSTHGSTVRPVAAGPVGFGEQLGLALQAATGPAAAEAAVAVAVAASAAAGPEAGLAALAFAGPRIPVGDAGPALPAVGQCAAMGAVFSPLVQGGAASGAMAAVGVESSVAGAAAGAVVAVAGPAPAGPPRVAEQAAALVGPGAKRGMVVGRAAMQVRAPGGGAAGVAAPAAAADAGAASAAVPAGAVAVPVADAPPGGASGTGEDPIAGLPAALETEPVQGPPEGVSGAAAGPVTGVATGVATGVVLGATQRGGGGASGKSSALARATGSDGADPGEDALASLVTTAEVVPAPASNLGVFAGQPLAAALPLRTVEHEAAAASLGQAAPGMRAVGPRIGTAGEAGPAVDGIGGHAGADFALKASALPAGAAPEPVVAAGGAPAALPSLLTSPVLSQAAAAPPSAAPVAANAGPEAAGGPARADAAPPPAAQVASAFVALAAARPGQEQPVVIRLAPAELGHVQVRIERATDGPAHVVLAVERTDTLMLLMQDRPQLDLALTAAGVSPEGRTLQFSLSSGGPGGGGMGGGLGSGPGGGSGGAGGGFAQGQGGGQGQQPPPLPRSAWLRAGVDITA